MEKKKSIYFLVQWGDDKQRAWSGTNWGLFQALSKRMDVQDIDVTVRHTFTERVLNKLKIKRYSHDMGVTHNRIGGRIAAKAMTAGGKRDGVFEFAEVAWDAACGMPTYLYVDLSAEYVAHMAEIAPDDFAVSSYQVYDKLRIVNRGGNSVSI